MPATRASLHADLMRLGIKPKDILMVHASVRSVGDVTGGANVIVQALFDAIGPEGTLTAYVDFEPFYEEDDGADIPVFDKRIAHAARDHGVLPETLRNWPGALRSDHENDGFGDHSGIQRSHLFGKSCQVGSQSNPTSRGDHCS